MDISEQMRADWNARAKEDAGYYVAFASRGQSDDEFFATASDTVRDLEGELRRVPAELRASWKALEIGCGPGRLMRPLGKHFAEIYGVDISDEMIALAREKLRDVPNAHPVLCDGSRLTMFADESIDFVYSYAVFQHIPSRDVVLEYLREVHRVLKIGGLARLQLYGLAPHQHAAYDTWEGARFSAEEILDFASAHDLQVLALDGAATQYMWTTWCKQPRGWQIAQQNREFSEPPTRIRRITNAKGTEPFAPLSGHFASISLRVENLPPEAGLHQIRVSIGELYGEVIYIGAQDNTGFVQINVALPALQTTGLLPVKLWWLDSLIAPPATLRITPPVPAIPRILSVSDAINLSSGPQIETRLVRISVEEVLHPEEMAVAFDSKQVLDMEYLCADPRRQLYEINFRLPAELGSGYYPLELTIGRRKFAPITVQVV
jgi:ubiquinone/menaquinone biosynthesis C-methylase UbiE